MGSWKAAAKELASQSNCFAKSESLFPYWKKIHSNSICYENGLFSSSLSDLFDKKLRLPVNGVFFQQHDDTFNSNVLEDERFASLKEIEAQTIGNLLPDEDDLLSGAIEDAECFARLDSGPDMEDDLFCSGGGIELDVDCKLKCIRSSRLLSVPSPTNDLGGFSSLFTGEHLCGGHPSRTLFVRNISSNVEDAELRVLFEQYGDIHTLYTACKHRGFVVLSYYDIRAAQNAMRALQNLPLRHRKLDIHFPFPKDNQSDKDINQGSLAIFNVGSSVSNDDLHQIFGVYGEIKQISEAHNHQHKFIEYYDVRAAKAALHALNRSDITGNKIKLELCHPGETRQRSMQPPYVSPKLEQDPVSFSHKGAFSTTRNYGSTGNALSAKSATQAPRTLMENAFDGISSSLPYNMPSPVMDAALANHGNHYEENDSLGDLNLGIPCGQPLHPHSLTEYHAGITNRIRYETPSMSSMAVTINKRIAEEVAYTWHVQRVASDGLDGLGVSDDSNCFLHAQHYALNSSFNRSPCCPPVFSGSPSDVNNISANASFQLHGLARSPSNIRNAVIPSHHYHIGSAPAVNPLNWEEGHLHLANYAEMQGFNPSFGNNGYCSSSLRHSSDLVAADIFLHDNGNCIGPSLPSGYAGSHSTDQRGHIFHGKNRIRSAGSFDISTDHIRRRRGVHNLNHIDNKKQYELDIHRIICGEDLRTTLMIKNIPNKYTSKMLLATIDEHHRGTYNFIYLPIDFKNKCNVGYAFINMIDPQHIISFYQVLNGKKWEKFNSEKVASLAYARIQGKAALVAHFQNSSLMNEDKRCRPILFNTHGPNAGDQEPFPIGPNVHSRVGRSRTITTEENHQHISPPSSGSGEEL